MKRNILFITIRSDMGGGPKHLVDLLSRIPRNKFDIHSASPLASPFGRTIRELSNGHTIIPHRRFSLKSFFDLRKVIQSKNITIIHSHGRGAGIYARALTLITPTKVVHTFHGVHNGGDLLSKTKLFVDRLLSRFTAAFICVSKDEEHEALSLQITNKDRSHVVYNGVDLRSFPYSPLPHNNKIILGTLARLNYQKGLDLLLTNLSSFIKNHPNNFSFEIRIAGSGELKESLDQKLAELGISSHISFVGERSDPAAFLKELDIYISSARWEGFPLGVIEAASIGRPALLSDVVGHTYFKTKNCALLYDLYDPEDFSKRLLEMLSSAELRDQLAENGNKLVKEELNLEKMTEKTIQIYEKLSPL